MTEYATPGMIAMYATDIRLLPDTDPRRRAWLDDPFFPAAADNDEEPESLDSRRARVMQFVRNTIRANLACQRGDEHCEAYIRRGGVLPKLW